MERLNLAHSHRGPRATVADEPGRAPDGDAGPEPRIGAPVVVISGASVQTFPLGGTRVAAARERLGEILRIEPEAAVLVDGHPVEPSHVLAAGSTLEFVKHAGEKG